MCRGGGCAAPGCTDTTKNGGETGIDCGGPACPRLPDRQWAAQPGATARAASARAATVRRDVHRRARERQRDGHRLRRQRLHGLRDSARSALRAPIAPAAIAARASARLPVATTTPRTARIRSGLRRAGLPEVPARQRVRQTTLIVRARAAPAENARPHVLRRCPEWDGIRHRLRRRRLPHLPHRHGLQDGGRLRQQGVHVVQVPGSELLGLRRERHGNGRQTAAVTARSASRARSARRIATARVSGARAACARPRRAPTPRRTATRPTRLRRRDLLHLCHRQGVRHVRRLREPRVQPAAPARPPRARTGSPTAPRRARTAVAVAARSAQTALGCTASTDCQSARCVNGTCQAAGCTDAVKNGGDRTSTAAARRAARVARTERPCAAADGLHERYCSTTCAPPARTAVPLHPDELHALRLDHCRRMTRPSSMRRFDVRPPARSHSATGVARTYRPRSCRTQTGGPDLVVRPGP